MKQFGRGQSPQNSPYVTKISYLLERYLAGGEHPQSRQKAQRLPALKKPNLSKQRSRSLRALEYTEIPKELRIEQVVKSYGVELVETKATAHLRPQFTHKRRSHFKTQPDELSQLYAVRARFSKCKMMAFRDLPWKVAFIFGLSVPPCEHGLPLKVHIEKGLTELYQPLFSLRSWWKVVSHQAPGINLYIAKQPKPAFLKTQPFHSRLRLPQQKEQDELLGEGNKYLRQEARVLGPSRLRLWVDYFSTHFRQDFSTEDFRARNSFIWIAPEYSAAENSTLHNFIPQACTQLDLKGSLYFSMQQCCARRGLDFSKMVPAAIVLRDIADLDDHLAKLKALRPAPLCVKSCFHKGANCYFVPDYRAAIKVMEQQMLRKYRSFRLQTYVKPYCFKDKKFVVRETLLLALLNGQFKGFCYKQGFTRTQTLDLSETALTGFDAQSYKEEYNCVEDKQAFSLQQLDEFARGKGVPQLSAVLFPRILEIMRLALDSAAQRIDPSGRNNFQLVQMDFLIDENMLPWLIKSEPRPPFQLDCPFTRLFYPRLVEEAVRLVVDSIFPPPRGWHCRQIQHAGIEANHWVLFYQQTVHDR